MSDPLRPGDIKAELQELGSVWSLMLTQFFRDGELDEACSVEVPCPHCGHTEVEQVFRLKGFRHGTCVSCATVYVSPRLTDDCIEELYSNEYYNTLYMTSILPMFTQRTQLLGRGKFDQLAALLGGQSAGRVLDIGAGVGEILEVFRDEGWATHAIEMNEKAVDWLSERGHTEVFHGRLQDYDEATHNFDVIMAWGVVEHVLDADDFLTRVHGLLAPGGMFVSEVPHAQSLLVDVVRRSGMDPGRIVMGEQHIKLYSVGAYTELHERNGLVLAHMQTNGLDVSTLLEKDKSFLPDGLLAAMQQSIDARSYGDLLRGFWWS